ncbi:MAG: hypothetical protein PHG66_01050 [Candidatus Colwellbacteria bacterium]|nr:hypothetical protein [Candidatus Colwellbacteria bacterium]
MKGAIVKSNAETLVKVGDETLSVAEVIERKKSLSIHTNLLMKLKTQRESILRTSEYANAQMEPELQKLIEIHFGKSSNGKTNPDDIEAISRPFRENNCTKVIDPIGIDSKIKELETYVENFEREAKFVLSESNALTKIKLN